MAKWFFEPGHTAAGFCVRHMMVTFVRGHFKDIHGTLVFDPADPGATSVEATIEATGIWTGEAARDAHLKSADFLDVEKHPKITFAGKQVELAGADEAVPHRRLDDSRYNPHRAAARPLSRTMADSMVGRRSGQRTESPDGLYRHRHDQSPRLRRELEQHSRQRWRRRRQQG
jgi:hypothetical protein